MSRGGTFIATIACLAAVTAGTVAAAQAPGLPLRVVQPDIVLPGRPDRFDYASIDAVRRLLFIAHLGSDIVTVVDLRTLRVAANVADVPGVHGVLAVPELGEVFATATDRNQIDVISERDFRIIGQAPAGVYPDGMAYAPTAHRLFVSDEAGHTETVIDTNSAIGATHDQARRHRPPPRSGAWRQAGGDVRKTADAAGEQRCPVAGGQAP